MAVDSLLGGKFMNQKDVDALQWFELPGEELVQRMLRFVFLRLQKKGSDADLEDRFIQEQMDSCQSSGQMEMALNCLEQFCREHRQQHEKRGQCAVAKADLLKRLVAPMVTFLVPGDSSSAPTRLKTRNPDALVRCLKAWVISVSPEFAAAMAEEQQDSQDEVPLTDDEEDDVVPPASNQCHNPLCPRQTARGGGPVNSEEPCMCTDCKCAMYCSLECQTAHWDIHKWQCSTLVEFLAVETLFRTHPAYTALLRRYAKDVGAHQRRVAVHFAFHQQGPAVLRAMAAPDTFLPALRGGQAFPVRIAELTTEALGDLALMEQQEGRSGVGYWMAAGLLERYDPATEAVVVLSLPVHPDDEDDLVLHAAVVPVDPGGPPRRSSGYLGHVLGVICVAITAVLVHQIWKHTKIF
eukprot:EG_transcript_12382